MKDESLSAVIEDITPPTGMELCNTQIFPGYPQHSMMYNLQVSRRYNPPSLSLSLLSLSQPQMGWSFLTYETEFVLFLVMLENSVLPMG